MRAFIDCWLRWTTELREVRGQREQQEQVTRRSLSLSHTPAEDPTPGQAHCTPYILPAGTYSCMVSTTAARPMIPKRRVPVLIPRPASPGLPQAGHIQQAPSLESPHPANLTQPAGSDTFCGLDPARICLQAILSLSNLPHAQSVTRFYQFHLFKRPKPASHHPCLLAGTWVSV